MVEPKGTAESYAAKRKDSEETEDNFKDAMQEEHEESDDDDDDDNASEKDYGDDVEEDYDGEEEEEENSPVRSAEFAPRNTHQSHPPPPYLYYGYPPVSATGYPSYVPIGSSNYSFLPPPPPPASSMRSTYVDNAHAEDPAPDGRRNRGGVVKPFPEVLHLMLSTLELEGKADVASFFSHGRAFAIHKPRIFTCDVMPRFFKQTKLTSFLLCIFKSKYSA